MLPDIIPLKLALAKVLDDVFRRRFNDYMGALNEAPRCYIKEGRRIVTIRPDGQIDETILNQASAEMSLRFEEVPELDITKRLAKLDEAAREIAKQVSGHAFRQINESVEKLGNVVNGTGKPFSPDVLLQALERIQLEFDPSGNPEDVTVVIPPHMTQQARDTIEVMKRDPDFQRRYNAIIDQKRTEWRDREAARKLVG